MSDAPVLHRGIGVPTKCRTCKETIVWAYTLGGKRAPFQADDAGDHILENGTARKVGPPSQQLELGAAPGPQRYVSHFAHCPQAADWRNRGD